MTSLVHWTVQHLEGFPQDDGNRYEIIEGELHVTAQLSVEHQTVCGNCYSALRAWAQTTGGGRVILAPGVIFAAGDAVAPDLVWVSEARLPLLPEPDGVLHDAPDLVVEVVSPGRENERRDRETKLDLYSRRGVREYWIVDWKRRQVAVYRHERAALRPAATVLEAETLESPLLPGFSCPAAALFADIPDAR